jgi:hypothetical protein
MDIQHSLKESELTNHIEKFGFTLQAGKDECVRQLETAWSSQRQILEKRVEKVLKLREKLVSQHIDYSDCKEAEQILKAYNPTPESKIGEEQVFFTGEHTKILNHIPYFLTILVFLKVYVGPVLALFTPFFLFLMPWFILKYTMNMDMPWEVYITMMKSMVFGIQGNTWTMKHYVQILWTSVSIGQSMIQPMISAYHTYKTDTLILRRGEALVHFVKRGSEILDWLRSRSIMPHYLKFPEVPMDPREAAVWMDEEPLAMKRIWTLWGQIDILFTIARNQEWKSVIFTGGLFRLTNFSDLAIPEKRAIKSSLDLKSHALLTGPNRGGKSSSLRAILQQVFLGQTFGFTYSAEGAWTPFGAVFTRLKSKDHAGKESLFEMEVRMASHILQTLSKIKKPSLVLIDELFHSTNPPDAETSARIFLEQLWKHTKAKSIISTHIFSLCEKTYSDSSIIESLCCPAKELETGSIEYSYKLEEGICRMSSVREVLKEAGLF